MEIKVAFDEATIRRYHARGASPVFSIYWAHNGMAYPSDDWTDFGAVILGWWLVAVEGLINGAPEARFPFMDGPFALIARTDGDETVVFTTEGEINWEMSTDELVRSINRAASKVERELRRLGVGKREREALTRGMQSIKESNEPGF